MTDSSEARLSTPRIVPSKPLISVVLTSFNHEPFIAAAVTSILKQTYSHFELIIVDDGSTDASRNILEELADSRVALVFQENAGPSAALNKGIARCHGEYVALMSSDDVSYPERLEKQLEYAQVTGTDLGFALPHIINEKGDRLEDASFDIFFNTDIHSSKDALRRFFYYGNFFCAPTAFIRRAVLEAVGPFHRSSIQLQDYEMWIRICKHHKVGLNRDRLLQYRRLSNGQNLSSVQNTIRCRFEFLQIMRHFLDDWSVATLKAVFPRLVRLDAADGDQDLEMDKSFIFLSHGDKLVRSIGMERLFAQLADTATAARLRKFYSFDQFDLYSLMQENDIENRVQLNRYLALCAGVAIQSLPPAA